VKAAYVGAQSFVGTLSAQIETRILREHWRKKWEAARSIRGIWETGAVVALFSPFRQRDNYTTTA
jgi:hypothetical protein